MVAEQCGHVPEKTTPPVAGTMAICETEYDRRESWQLASSELVISRGMVSVESSSNICGTTLSILKKRSTSALAFLSSAARMVSLISTVASREQPGMIRSNALGKAAMHFSAWADILLLPACVAFQNLKFIASAMLWLLSLLSQSFDRIFLKIVDCCSKNGLINLVIVFTNAVYLAVDWCCCFFVWKKFQRFLYAYAVVSILLWRFVALAEESGVGSFCPLKARYRVEPGDTLSHILWSLDDTRGIYGPNGRVAKTVAIQPNKFISGAGNFGVLKRGVVIIVPLAKCPNPKIWVLKNGMLSKVLPQKEVVDTPAHVNSNPQPEVTSKPQPVLLVEPVKIPIPPPKEIVGEPTEEAFDNLLNN